MKNRLLFNYVIAASVLFLLLLTGMYMSGYRIGPGLVLTKEQQIIITNLPNNAQVFLDYAPRGIAHNHTLTLSLVPGNHTILASAKTYWPWKHFIVVPENKSITVRAFLIPQVPKGIILTSIKKDNAEKKIDATVLPNNTHPLNFINKCISLTVSRNQIIATPIEKSSSCTPPSYLCIDNTCKPTVVFSSAQKISGVIPYPGRNDAIIISIGKNIYALSIDPRSPRTFAPLLKGIAPKIASGENETLLVRDEKTVYQLTL